MTKDQKAPARAVAPPSDERRCIHVGTQKGPDERCPNWAIKGGSVCKYHGGSTPVTKRAAQLRLLAASDIAIDVLVEALEHAGWKERVAAAFGVLDRSGFGAKSTVVHTTEEQDLSNLTTEQLDTLLDDLKNQIKENRLEAAIDRLPVTPAASESVN